ncbi:MAG TPA: TIGR03435 family protein [Vicinamibacterales bacterium]|jgi:uncharacterized protein (TIGR03435 family)|nr:TIGR03435 family protein [Vicinamibacterales bacterium]
MQRAVVVSVGLAAIAAMQVPRFDVASIKANTSATRAVGFDLPAGRVQITNAPLRFIIRQAYRIPEPRILGGPDWMGIVRFDITATAPTAGWTGDRARQMIQSLLADRFKLVTHMETRNLPIYTLVVAKTGSLGPNLRPAASDCANSGPKTADGKVQCGLLVSQAATSASLRGGGLAFADFVRTLGEYVDRPLEDRTGLQGRYDLDLQFTADRGAVPGGPVPGGLTATAADADIPTLPTALLEQLGLRLEATRGDVEVMVVDRVERPAEN